MKFILITALLFLASCSSVKMVQKKENRPLTHRERILLYYQKLREKQWSNVRKSPSEKAKIITIVPKRPKIKLMDTKEQSIEIEQSMIYYCMEQRKSNKFMIKNSCKQFTAKIYNQCQDKFQKGDARLTGCVISRLK